MNKVLNFFIANGENIQLNIGTAVNFKLSSSTSSGELKPQKRKKYAKAKKKKKKKSRSEKLPLLWSRFTKKAVLNLNYQRFVDSGKLLYFTYLLRQPYFYFSPRVYRVRCDFKTQTHLQT